MSNLSNIISNNGVSGLFEHNLVQNDYFFAKRSSTDDYWYLYDENGDVIQNNGNSAKIYSMFEQTAFMIWMYNIDDIRDYGILRSFSTSSNAILPNSPNIGNNAIIFMYYTDIAPLSLSYDILYKIQFISENGNEDWQFTEVPLGPTICIHKDMIIDDLGMAIKDVKTYSDDFVRLLYMGKTTNFIKIGKSIITDNVPSKDLLLTAEHPVRFTRNDGSVFDGPCEQLVALGLAQYHMEPYPVDIYALSFTTRKTTKMHNLDVWQWADNDFDSMLAYAGWHYCNDGVKYKKPI